MEHIKCNLLFRAAAKKSPAKVVEISTSHRKMVIGGNFDIDQEEEDDEDYTIDEGELE